MARANAGRGQKIIVWLYRRPCTAHHMSHTLSRQQSHRPAGRRGCYTPAGPRSAYARPSRARAALAARLPRPSTLCTLSLACAGPAGAQRILAAGVADRELLPTPAHPNVNAAPPRRQACARRAAPGLLHAAPAPSNRRPLAPRKGAGCPRVGGRLARLHTSLTLGSTKPPRRARCAALRARNKAGSAESGEPRVSHPVGCRGWPGKASRGRVAAQPCDPPCFHPASVFSGPPFLAVLFFLYHT